jgi:hypothetical protein
MKRVNTSFSVTVITLFMAGYNYTKWLVTVTLKEVFTLFMAGYNYTKRSVHSLVTVTSLEESELLFSVIVTSHAE